MPMKRSEIVKREPEFQKLVEASKRAVLYLLNSNKDNVYDLHEIIKFVAKDLRQHGLEMGFCDERVKSAIIKAIVGLESAQEITRENLGSKGYYGGK